MDDITGSWAVIYIDGSILAQYDSASEHFKAESGEVPYRAIDWPRVATIVFASQLLEEHFEIRPVGDDAQVSLRSRHFRTMGGDDSMCFIVITSRKGEEVSDDSVLSAFYWFPDGTTHDCHLFNCPDIATFGGKWAHGESRQLMPATHALHTSISGSAA